MKSGKLTQRRRGGKRHEWTRKITKEDFHYRLLHSFVTFREISWQKIFASLRLCVKNLFLSSVSVVAFLYFGMSCRPAIPAVDNISLCDDMGADKCASPMEPVRTYTFAAPENKKSSWFDLGYYMYFHSRQTPGMLVKFNRSLDSRELAILKESLHCNYRLEKDGKYLSGHLEGKRIDPDASSFWCFDYLGSMLVKFQKLHGDVRKKPEKSFFPVRLTLEFDSRLPGFKGEILSTISVDWEGK